MRPRFSEVLHGLSGIAAMQMHEELGQHAAQFPGQLFDPLNLREDERLQFRAHIHDASIVVFRRARFEPQRAGL